MRGIRIVSLILVSAALMLLGADMITWLETDAFDPHSLIGLWSAVHQPSADAALAWAGTLPAPVSDGARALLHAWAFAVFGLPGIGFAILGAKS